MALLSWIRKREDEKEEEGGPWVRASLTKTVSRALAPVRRQGSLWPLWRRRGYTPPQTRRQHNRDRDRKQHEQRLCNSEDLVCLIEDWVCLNRSKSIGTQLPEHLGALVDYPAWAARSACWPIAEETKSLKEFSWCSVGSNPPRVPQVLGSCSGLEQWRRTWGALLRRHSRPYAWPS